jgi:Methyltransferase domain
VYSENRTRDLVLFTKAVLSNQLARVAPAAYVRLTRQTGRGEGNEESPEQIADYFSKCFHDYGRQLGFDDAGFDTFLAGKLVLEYGPGDILGMALLLYAHGARAVHCFDRFPLYSASEKNLRVYEHLMASLSGGTRDRFASAFVENGRPASGFRPEAVAYFVSPDGLSGASRKYDLILSRAVLEHVGDLGGTVRDIAAALELGGVSIHEVDLRSHGLDRYRPFDFLTWPDSAYRLMFSEKGFPNRWRLNTYRTLFEQAGLHIRRLEPTARLPAEQVSLIEPHLASPLRGVSRDELAWMGFWVVVEHGAASDRASATTSPNAA